MIFQSKYDVVRDSIHKWITNLNCLTACSNEDPLSTTSECNNAVNDDESSSYDEESTMNSDDDLGTTSESTTSKKPVCNIAHNTYSDSEDLSSYYSKQVYLSTFLLKSSSRYFELFFMLLTSYCYCVWLCRVCPQRHR